MKNVVVRRALIGLVLLVAPGCATVAPEVSELRQIDLRQSQVFCFEKGGLLAEIRIDKDAEVVQARCVPLRRTERDS